MNINPFIEPFLKDLTFYRKLFHASILRKHTELFHFFLNHERTSCLKYKQSKHIFKELCNQKRDQDLLCLLSKIDLSKYSQKEIYTLCCLFLSKSCIQSFLKVKHHLTIKSKNRCINLLKAACSADLMPKELSLHENVNFNTLAKKGLVASLKEATRLGTRHFFDDSTFKSLCSSKIMIDMNINPFIEPFLKDLVFYRKLFHASILRKHTELFHFFLNHERTSCLKYKQSKHIFKELCNQKRDQDLLCLLSKIDLSKYSQKEIYALCCLFLSKSCIQSFLKVKHHLTIKSKNRCINLLKAACSADLMPKELSLYENVNFNTLAEKDLVLYLKGAVRFGTRHFFDDHTFKSLFQRVSKKERSYIFREVAIKGDLPFAQFLCGDFPLDELDTKVFYNSLMQALKRKRYTFFYYYYDDNFWLNAPKSIYFLTLLWFCINKRDESFFALMNSKITLKKLNAKQLQQLIYEIQKRDDERFLVQSLGKLFEA